MRGAQYQDLGQFPRSLPDSNAVFCVLNWQRGLALPRPYVASSATSPCAPAMIFNTLLSCSECQARIDVTGAGSAAARRDNDDEAETTRRSWTHWAREASTWTSRLPPSCRRLKPSPGPRTSAVREPAQQECAVFPFAGIPRSMHMQDTRTPMNAARAWTCGMRHPAIN